MKQTLLLIILFIFTQTIFAQSDSLLKKFKYRIDNYEAATININGGSQYSQRELGMGTYKNSASSGGIGGTYYTVKSTDKVLLNAAVGLSGVFYKQKASQPTIATSTNRNFSTSPNVSVLNKWFSKKMFTELGADIAGYFSTSKNVSQASPGTAKGKFSNYSIAVTMGIGKGRLENVTDMQNALWLVKELGKIDRLSAVLSNDDLLKLGQSITKGNNTRILDARKRTQFLLTTVDNYLQQKGVISKTDIRYFSSLNDILFFAFNNPRFSGTEKYIRLTPSTIGWDNKQDFSDGISKNRHKFTTQSAMLTTGFKKYIPSSLVHQNNYGAALKLTYFTSDLTDRDFINDIITTEIKGKTDLKQAGATLFYEHAIYPNTRTTVNINMQSELGYQDDKVTKEFYCTATLSSAFNYFISYRTRLSINAGVYYQKNNYAFENHVELLPDAIQLYANAGIAISL